MFEKIKERYIKFYVTIAQLSKYVELGAITAEQFTEISGQEYNQQRDISGFPDSSTRL